MADDLNVVRTFYGSNLEAVGPSFPALGWYAPETQRVRFEVFELLADLSHSHVLDAGCGLGDYFRFLLEKKHQNFKYTGVDVMDDFVQEARRRYGHHAFADFQTQAWSSLDQSFDWVLCSGALNLKQPDPYAYVRQHLAKFLSLARQGVGVNFLSGHGPAGPDDIFFHYDPIRISEIAFELTPNMALHHDYLPNDFTVFLYK